MKHRPLIVVAFDSYVQPSRGIPNCGIEIRRGETVEALDILLGYDEHQNFRDTVRFFGLRDDVPIWSNFSVRLDDIVASLRPDEIFFPAYEEGGHEQHNGVSRLTSEVVDRINANAVKPIKQTRYLTYVRGKGKSRSHATLPTHEVPIESADWIVRKHLALACYVSQHQLDPRLGCWPWFCEELKEYQIS